MRRVTLLLLFGIIAASCAASNTDGDAGGASGTISLPSTTEDDETSTTTDAVSPTTTAKPASARTVRLGVSSPFEADRSLDRRVIDLEREVVGDEFGAVRLYHRWDEPFPNANETFLREPGRETTPLLSISTQRKDGSWVRWSDLANASETSTLGRQLAQWADDIAAWTGPRIVITLDHEPDFYLNGGTGTAAEYIEAYRRFVFELRRRDAPVDTIWISVAFFYRPGGANQGPDFYPGNDFVDILGVDGFNWAACRQTDGLWRSFGPIFEDFRAWAETNHPDKPVILAELGTVEDLERPTRKAEWMREAASAMSRWEQVRMAIFWDNVHEDSPECDFRLDSTAAAGRAFAALAARDLFQL